MYMMFPSPASIDLDVVCQQKYTKGACQSVETNPHLTPKCVKWLQGPRDSGTNP